MSADVKREPRSASVRLVLTIVGALLMVGPPYAFEMLGLSARFQSTIVAAIEFVCLAAGLALLFLAFKGRASTS